MHNSDPYEREKLLKSGTNPLKALSELLHLAVYIDQQSSHLLQTAVSVNKLWTAVFEQSVLVTCTGSYHDVSQLFTPVQKL